MADFSDDHLGKRVVTQSGATLGTVTQVSDGDLHVEVEPDADRDTLTQLGWEGPVNQDVRRLEDRYVSNITDETIRLRV